MQLQGLYRQVQPHPVADQRPAVHLQRVLPAHKGAYSAHTTAIRCIDHAPQPNCPVEFEPGVRKFEYGSNSINKSAAGSGSSAPAANAFLRTQQAAKYQPGNLMQNEGNRAAMKQVDDDLDEVSGIVGDLKAIARAQGTEIERSTEQLDRLNIKADQTNQRIAANNKKIQYEIKHN